MCSPGGGREGAINQGYRLSDDITICQNLYTCDSVFGSKGQYNLAQTVYVKLYIKKSEKTANFSR